MIKIENVEVVGWAPSIRGMRNPMNSWAKSDSFVCKEETKTNEQIDATCGVCTLDKRCCPEDDSDIFVVGPNDHDLMMRLANGGPVHAKYRRFIDVYLDITAPFYWWKEFRTYRRGVKYMDEDRSFEMDDVLDNFIEMNSCSTMHKIHEKEFTLDDFSHEHLDTEDEFTMPCDNGCSDDYYEDGYCAEDVLDLIIHALNHYRKLYLETKDKKYWYTMIQLLPSSYNQKRTVKLNYEVLAAMYEFRKNHKQDCWRVFCSWIESLPYSEIITGVRRDVDERN